MPSDLLDVPTEELLKEVQRRLECQTKPEKRLILVGQQHISSACMFAMEVTRCNASVVKDGLACRSTWMWERHAVTQAEGGALPLSPGHR